MTESEYLHHAEQVDAARVEFAGVFDRVKKEVKEINRMRIFHYITTEQACWKTFLLSKGLIK